MSSPAPYLRSLCGWDAKIPGPHPHTDKIVVELVQAVEDGEKSAQEALDTLAGLGLIERVPREATT